MSPSFPGYDNTAVAGGCGSDRPACATSPLPRARSGIQEQRARQPMRGPKACAGLQEKGEEGEVDR